MGLEEGNVNIDLNIKEFDYNLPDSAIARYPLPERDLSKLLVWDKGALSDHSFSDLPELLHSGSMLLFNNTQVIRARLLFTKSTGAKIEVFCLEPSVPHEYVISFAQTSVCRWKCIVGNLKRWKGESLEMEVAVNGGRKTENGKRKTEHERLRRGAPVWAPDCNEGEIVVLTARLTGEMDGGYEVEFTWDNPKYTFAEILEAAGNIPIPPYLHRESEEIDATVYQTVYSKIKGSVAAPTAGLHFTERIFARLAEKNISCEELTLHVGAGTFQPVKSDTIGEHKMHTEHFSVSKELIDKLIAHPSAVFAVGTTSVRTLESLYWIGCKILENPQIKPDQLSVNQWDPYPDHLQSSSPKVSLSNSPTVPPSDCLPLASSPHRPLSPTLQTDAHTGAPLRKRPFPVFRVPSSVLRVPSKLALQAISDYLSKTKTGSLETTTQIMIVPGYRFRIIDGLVTNFHQPQSTLLLLISAILGADWKRVYDHALDQKYRFLSYGDANLYLI